MNTEQLLRANEIADRLKFLRRKLQSVKQAQLIENRLEYKHTPGKAIDPIVTMHIHAISDGYGKNTLLENSEEFSHNEMNKLIEPASMNLLRTVVLSTFKADIEKQIQKLETEFSNIH